VIPFEAIESCRELLIALLEFAGGDPGPRRHAALVYHCYLHALRGGTSRVRWSRFIAVLQAHLALDGTSDESAAAFLRRIVSENADLLPLVLAR
jgi:hypothetical protein